MSTITTIQVSDETWKELNERKQPGDSFDDVVSRMLDDTGGDEP